MSGGEEDVEFDPREGRAGRAIDGASDGVGLLRGHGHEEQSNNDDAAGREYRRSRCALSGEIALFFHLERVLPNRRAPRGQGDEIDTARRLKGAEQAVCVGRAILARARTLGRGKATRRASVARRGACGRKDGNEMLIEILSDFQLSSLQEF